MLLKQRFKTSEGASKRAAFENAHCEKRFRYTVERFGEQIDAQMSNDYFMRAQRSGRIWWQIKKERR